MISHTFRDGGSISGPDDIVAAAASAELDDVAREQEWIAELMEAGVRAAHPDDGWVDREANTVALVYPQFDLGVQAGDIIALGRPDRHRIVHVTGRQVHTGLTATVHLQFREDAEVQP